MGFAHGVAATVGKVLRSVHAGERKLAAYKLDVVATVPSIEVASPDFEAGGELPREVTVDGAGVPPTIAWRGVPPWARSLAVFCEDPDSPSPEPFVHWVVYGLPPTVTVIDGKPNGYGHEGKNSKLESEYTPPAAWPGHGMHHYHFQVFALDIELDLDPGAGRHALLTAMRGHVVAWGELVGTYERR